MSKMQKIILILIILVLIISIAIITILIINQKKYQGLSPDAPQVIEPVQEISKVTNRSDFYMVQNCITNFYSYYSIIANAEEYYDGWTKEQIDKAKLENAGVIYDLLDEKYIEYKGITKQNILSKLGEIYDVKPMISSMYVSEKTETFAIYIVNGDLRNKKTNARKEFKVIVKIDHANESFSIILDDYINEKYPNLAEGGTINITESTKVKSNKNNKYTHTIISDKDYAIDLFNNYKEEAEYNPKLLYDKLDEEYKKAKFTSLSEFEKYIKNRYTKISMLKLESYNKTIENRIYKIYITRFKWRLLYI